MPSPIRSVVATTLDPSPSAARARSIALPDSLGGGAARIRRRPVGTGRDHIEGFTTLVERLGDLEARALMQVHNRIVRAALLEHAGREVAHTGDGIMAAFRSVAAALQAAIEIQCALEAHTRAQPEAALAPRIGVHAGEPLPEEGRLFGTCVDTAVRVCEASGATRVLVSDLARQLAAGRAFGSGQPAASHSRGSPCRCRSTSCCGAPKAGQRATSTSTPRAGR